MKDYSIRVETVDGGTNVIILGGGYMAQKLSLILQNRGFGCAVISRAKDFDISSTPEFIFLFNDHGDPVPEAVLNFLEVIKSKLIIVSIDRPFSDDITKQFQDKQADYCLASIYDIFGVGGVGSVLENVFLGIESKKLIAFKNDQIVVTPIFVDDAVEALCRIAFSTQTYKKNYLITGKEEIPLVGFTQRVWNEGSRIFGILPKPEEGEKEYPQPFPRHEKILKRDSSYSLLSWKPEVSLSEGISSALNNLRLSPIPPLSEIKKKMTSSPEYLPPAQN